MNLTILVGRLGQNPETKQTQSGNTVCNFSVATSRGKDNTDWHKVVAWDKTAELCGEYLKKGDRVGIQGSSQTRSYEAQDGSTRYTTEVVAHRVEFLTEKPKGDYSGAYVKESAPAQVVEQDAPLDF